MRFVGIPPICGVLPLAADYYWELLLVHELLLNESLSSMCVYDRPVVVFM